MEDRPAAWFAGGIRPNFSDPMPQPRARFFFDFVDPLSYLTELAIRELETAGEVRIDRVGYEVHPPPLPLTRLTDPIWTDRLAAARRAAPAFPLHPPAWVPWTRKAHELHLFARGCGAEDAVRHELFEAYFGHARDIGRIDELVEIAERAGLDRTETKAALDVDKYHEAVIEARRAADRRAIGDPPALLVGGELVRGFHNLTDLSTLLGGPPAGGR